MSQDLIYMALALEEAKKCVPTPTAFCVGAVIVLPKDAQGNTTDKDIIISTGYSRELPGNTHAEQCSLDKLADNTRPPPKSAVIYTTMEPCSERLSGNVPCVDRIIGSGIFKSVKVGVIEPDTFIRNNVGKQKLDAAGIQYVLVSGLEKECLEVATSGH
ncbi:cytidine deaminase-like protein [Lipomyces chichibuensis]|uniref:cytidine deaminase-like protein n=1 Tax=Lipomyces chichibuensis TaxID=1546026 RepID=UPI003343E5D8